MSSCVPAKNRAARGVYTVAGIGFVGLGVLGAILPGLPSTVFFLLALWAFKRSSPKLEQWLLDNRFIGPTLRDWDEHRSIRPVTRNVAIAVIWLTIGASIYFLQSWWMGALLATVAIGVTAYLMTVKLRFDAG